MESPPLTVVSNRLPVVFDFDEHEGVWKAKPGSGGLVRALTPILEASKGRWIGWPGVSSERADGELPIEDINARIGYEVVPVPIEDEAIDKYYAGFSNSVIWPLFHGFPDRCDFDPEFWNNYIRVNEKFASVIAETVEPDEILWIHDYHLIHAGSMVRNQDLNNRIGFFLHIPFPQLQNFLKLPWRADLMRALLSYDLLGFQTARDCRHFIDCVRQLVPDVEIAQERPIARIRIGDHTLWVGAFPIGIDAGSFSDRADTREVMAKMVTLRKGIGPYDLMVGVDRLDYTKGLIQRLEAYEHMLEKYPDLQKQVVLLQLVVPSRENVPEYAALKRDVDELVGRINGRFSTVEWVPIRYLYNSVPSTELMALYRQASVALVTPLCDGMNLVSKEYCACQVDLNGVLVLGEMAGAAAQLEDSALLVNPYDIEKTAETIQQALRMDLDERSQRMEALRNAVHRDDVFWWADTFLGTLKDPENFSRRGNVEYLPQIDVDAETVTRLH